MDTTPRNGKCTSFILPDLISHCKYQPAYHICGDHVAKQSARWLDAGCPDLDSKQRRVLYGLQAGELAAFCYNTAEKQRLRVISDIMNFLFHLDNISGGLMTRETDVLSNAVMNALWFPHRFTPTEKCPKELNSAKLARDFWSRCVEQCGPGPQSRFKESMSMFFQAMKIQARARDEDKLLDLDSYISLRRDASGCKPCWVLIEYALGIDLPEFVVENSAIQKLNQLANDLVTWSYDIFSYNVEQSRGEGQNMIVILMKRHSHTLQSAIDYVGQLCVETMDNFEEYKRLVPSWGPEVDDMVVQYIQSLQDCMIGSLHWSFQTHRYFGTRGMIVKRQRLVLLLPSKNDVDVVHSFIQHVNSSLFSILALMHFMINFSRFS